MRRKDIKKTIAVIALAVIVSTGTVNVAAQSNKMVTREEFCVSVAKTFGLEQNSYSELPFNDVDQIATENIPFIISLYENGILYGQAEADGIYMRPNSGITVHDAVVLLGRIIDKQSQDEEAQGGYELADYAIKYWGFFIENGIIDFAVDSELDPTKPITFNQLSTIVSKIQKFTMKNEVVVSSLVGSGSRGYVDGNLLHSHFTMPYSMLHDSEGSLIIFDTYNNLIRRATEENTELVAGAITAIDNIGFAKGYYADGELDESLLNRPTSGVYNKSGQLFIADSKNNVIRFIRDGKMYTYAGSTAAFEDGEASRAKFNNPMAIAIDENDNIYVADTLNHCIRMIDTKGNVTTIAGVPEEYGFADGDSDNALFSEPAGIAVSADGTVIYVSDTGNHKIRKIENGKVTTVAGLTISVDEDNIPYGGFKDGSEEEAQFNLPRGLALVDNFIVVADSGNNRIRLINNKGDVMTLCGNGEPGDKDGAAMESRLNHPMGVIYYDGNIYIADTTNNKIKVVPFNSDIYAN